MSNENEPGDFKDLEESEERRFEEQDKFVEKVKVGSASEVLEILSEKPYYLLTWLNTISREFNGSSTVKALNKGLRYSMHREPYVDIKETKKAGIVDITRTGPDTYAIAIYYPENSQEFYFHAQGMSMEDLVKLWGLLKKVMAKQVVSDQEFISLGMNKIEYSIPLDYRSLVEEIDNEEKQKVLEALLQIPPGAVTTSKALETKLGISFRKVNMYLAQERDGEIYPCYKVIGNNGCLVPGFENQKELLTSEGIGDIGADGKVDEKYIY